MKNFKLLLMVLACALTLPDVALSAGEVELTDRTRQIEEGAALYDEHCARCHRSFAETTKPQRSVNRLRSSIEHFPAMRDLDSLNEQQLEALAAALATIPLHTGEK